MNYRDNIVYMSRGAETVFEMITLFTPLRTYAGNGFIVVQLEFQVSHLVAWNRQPQEMTEIRLGCSELLVWGIKTEVNPP